MPQVTTDTASAPRIKRRILFIKKGLQTKFILLVVISVFLAVSLMGWDLYDTFGRDVVRDLMDPGLYDMFLKIGQVLMAKLAIYMAVVVIVALFVSHRLAGPLYRFERSARAVSGGDLTHRVQLRKGDEMMDLQDEFNVMIQSLQQRVAKDRHLSERIVTQMQELAQNKAIPAESLQRLRDLQNEISHLTNAFKI